MMSWLNDFLANFGASNQSAAAEDLLTWEEENDQLLPEGWTAEAIAAAEAAGYVVDLDTGELISLDDVNNYQVKL